MAEGNEIVGDISGRAVQARDVHGNIIQTDVHMYMGQAPPRPQGPPEEPGLVRLRDAYLRWLSDRHRWTEAAIAGRRVRSPLSEAPARERLVSDGSTPFARAVEVEHLGSRARGSAGGGEAAHRAALARQPLPTYLAPPGTVDPLDLAAGEPVAAGDVLATAWRAVVLGDPGGGKSTLVRRLVRQETDRAPTTAPTTGAAAAAPDTRVWRLPVLCRASDLVRALAEGSTAEADLAEVAITAGWDAVPPFDPDSADTLPAAELQDLVRRHAERDGVLLVVDGLDEVATLDERVALAAALDGFAGGVRLGLPDRAPGNRVLVTSRVMGYHAAPLGERFEQFLLAPLAPGAAEEIGRHWVAAHTDDAGAGPAAGEAFREELDRCLATPRIMELAANPYLLVSLVSAVVSGTFQRRHGIGDRWLRCDLYQVMTDDAVRRATGKSPGADPDFVLGLHMRLAHRVHRDSRTGLVDRDRLREVLAEIVTGPDDGDPAGGDSWRDPERAFRLVEAAGLLVERGQSLYGFLHLTVAEYLAGRHITAADPDDPHEPLRTVRDHLGDPRWVEPLRLGLGHLGRTAPDGFDRLVRGLLEGDHGLDGLELFSGALDDVAAVAPGHVHLAVEAALSGIRAQAASSVSFSAALLLPVLSAPVAPGEERPVTTAAGALAAALGARSPDRVDAAARLAEILPITDRRVAQALFEAQYADGSARGWHTVRALHALLHRWEGVRPPGRDTDGGDPVTELLDTRGPDWRTRLAGVELSRAPAPPATVRGLRGGILSARSAPMRAALRTGDGRGLLDWALDRPAWVRLLICLYGGLPLNGVAALREERDRLLGVLRGSTETAADRRQAALRLDTVVMPTLARAERTGFSVEDISADSPLTPRVLEWLTGRLPQEEVVRHLATCAADTAQSPQARGDALAARLVMTGDLGPGGVPDLGADPAVASRARWRLDRAWYHLRDALPAVPPGPIVDALDHPAVPAPPTAWAPGWRSRHIPTERSETERPFNDHGPRSADDPLQALLRAVCVNDDAERGHRAAVLIDTAGGRIGADALARACAMVHRSDLAPSGDWPFDPLLPEPPEHRLLGAALGNLALLTPRWAFVRCWVLRRLAEPLLAAGLGAEAAALAWRDRAADPTGAQHVLSLLLPVLTAADGPSCATPGAEDLPLLLSHALRGITDPYDRARALVALAAAERRRLSAGELTGLTAAVPDPHERLRVGEYAVALGIAPPNPRASLTGHAEAVTDPALAAAARERLRRLGPESPGPVEPVLRAFTEVGESIAAWQSDPPLTVERLVHNVCGNALEGADRYYQVAVLLDTCGRALSHHRGIGLARALAEAHLVPAPIGTDWLLDPNGPTTGPVLSEALTNLAALDSSWAFLRCWMLDRLAPDLVADGYGLEALCLALRDIPADRSGAGRTAARLLERLGAADTRHGTAPHGGTALFPRLSGMADAIGPSYPRARARLHLAALRGTARFRPEDLSDLMATVPGAAERVRLAELALSLRLVRPHPGLLRPVSAEVDRMGDDAERARATLRMRAVFGDGLPDRHASEDAPVVPGPLSAPLFALERDRSTGTEDPFPAIGWAVLTAAAYCADVLPGLLDGSGPAGPDAEWSRLSRPMAADDRAAAVRALLVAGELRPHELGTTAVQALEALLASDEVDAVAQLLMVSRLPGHTVTTGGSSFTDRLRAVGDPGIADLAVLLALEAGHLDTDTVAALPRLVSAPEDRVRLRTGTALSSVSRGGSGPPRFSAARLGAPVLAAVAGLCVKARGNSPALVTELNWMLSDIGHDSPAVLRDALEGLDASARKEILASSHTLRPALLDELSEHLLTMPPEDQVHALWALRSTAAYPDRYGLAEERIADLVTAVQAVAADADDAVFAEALLVLGFALPATAESAEDLLGELALYEDGHCDRVVGEAACQALGHLVHRMPGGLDSAPAVRTALDRLASSGSPDVAAAAVGALARGGERVEERAGEIAPVTLVRGLLSAVGDLLYGDTEESELRRVADFITAPPDLSGADGDHHTRSLIAALLEWAVRGIGSGPARRRAASGHSLDDILGVLAVLAARQAAAVREAVAAHPLDVPGILRDHLVRADNWVERQSTAQILACLGRGDAATLAAVLATATDTDVIRSRVLARAVWFDSVEPDALDLLLATLEDPSLARAQFAVEILVSLVGGGVLDAEQRHRTLDAIRSAAERPDGHRRLIREQRGRMAVAQPFAELCRAALRGLGAPVTAETGAGGGAAVSRIRVDGRNGRRISLQVREGAVLADPCTFQLEWWRDVGGGSVASEVEAVLREVWASAHKAGVPVTALLETVLAAEEV